MSATPGMPDPAAVLGDRQNRLRLLLAEATLDAVALVPGPNLIYFSGAAFHLSERPVLGLFPVRGKPIFLVPVLMYFFMRGKMPPRAAASTHERSSTVLPLPAGAQTRTTPPGGHSESRSKSASRRTNRSRAGIQVVASTRTRIR